VHVDVWRPEEKVSNVRFYFSLVERRRGIAVLCANAGHTQREQVTVQVVARGVNEKTLKNLHFGPGSLLENLAMWIFEGFEPQASYISDGNAA
jgi:hypothetical protein